MFLITNSGKGSRKKVSKMKKKGFKWDNFSQAFKYVLNSGISIRQKKEKEQMQSTEEKTGRKETAVKQDRFKRLSGEAEFT